MIPHYVLTGPAEYATGGEYMDDLLRERHLKNQQMEAANRWKLLEDVTPDKDITSLNHKMQVTNTKSQPHLFYDHEASLSPLHCISSLANPEFNCTVINGLL